VDIDTAQSLFCKEILMERSKIVAIVTGVFSILLAIAYLILVQILDFRGEMKPAPVSQLNQPAIVAYHQQPEQLR
jgi:hypothetical protein